MENLDPDLLMQVTRAVVVLGAFALVLGFPAVI
jgi:hypothetical protein